MAEISIDYANVMKQVQKLRNTRKDLSGEIRNLRATQTRVATNWKGPAATLFYQKLEGQCTELSQLSDEIDTIASKIQTVADRIKCEDEEIAKASQKL